MASKPPRVPPPLPPPPSDADLAELEQFAKRRSRGSHEYHAMKEAKSHSPKNSPSEHQLKKSIATKSSASGTPKRSKPLTKKVSKSVVRQTLTALSEETEEDLSSRSQLTRDKAESFDYECKDEDDQSAAQVPSPRGQRWSNEELPPPLPPTPRGLQRPIAPHHFNLSEPPSMAPVPPLSPPSGLPLLPSPPALPAETVDISFIPPPPPAPTDLFAQEQNSTNTNADEPAADISKLKPRPPRLLPPTAPAQSSRDEEKNTQILTERSLPILKPSLEKYRRMKNAGLPEGAVRHAMARDGVDAPEDFWTENCPSSSPETQQMMLPSTAQQQPIPEAPVVSLPSKPVVVEQAPIVASQSGSLDKYKRMLKAGLPDAAIRHAMTRDGAQIPDDFPFNDIEISRKAPKESSKVDQLPEDVTRKEALASSSEISTLPVARAQQSLRSSRKLSKGQDLDKVSSVSTCPGEDEVVTSDNLKESINANSVLKALEIDRDIVGMGKRSNSSEQTSLTTRGEDEQSIISDAGSQASSASIESRTIRRLASLRKLSQQRRSSRSLGIVAEAANTSSSSAHSLPTEGSEHLKGNAGSSKAYQPNNIALTSNELNNDNNDLEDSRTGDNKNREGVRWDRPTLDNALATELLKATQGKEGKNLDRPGESKIVQTKNLERKSSSSSQGSKPTRELLVDKLRQERLRKQQEERLSLLKKHQEEEEEEEKEETASTAKEATTVGTRREFEQKELLQQNRDSEVSKTQEEGKDHSLKIEQNEDLFESQRLAELESERERLAQEIEQEDLARKSKENAIRKENDEERLRAAKEKEEEKERLQAAKEREEEEERLQAAKEREEEEERLQAAKEREEEEERLRAAKEREEEEERLRAAKEREEEEERLRAAKEREEEEERLRAAKEREEEEKRLAARRAREQEFRSALISRRNREQDQLSQMIKAQSQELRKIFDDDREELELQILSNFAEKRHVVALACLNQMKNNAPVSRVLEKDSGEKPRSLSIGFTRRRRSSAHDHNPTDLLDKITIVAQKIEEKQTEVDETLRKSAKTVNDIEALKLKILECKDLLAKSAFPENQVQDKLRELEAVNSLQRTLQDAEFRGHHKRRKDLLEQIQGLEDAEQRRVVQTAEARTNEAIGDIRRKLRLAQTKANENYAKQVSGIQEKSKEVLATVQRKTTSQFRQAISGQLNSLRQNKPQLAATLEDLKKQRIAAEREGAILAREMQQHGLPSVSSIEAANQYIQKMRADCGADQERKISVIKRDLEGGWAKMRAIGLDEEQAKHRLVLLQKLELSAHATPDLLSKYRREIAKCQGLIPMLLAETEIAKLQAEVEACAMQLEKTDLDEATERDALMTINRRSDTIQDIQKEKLNRLNKWETEYGPLPRGIASKLL